MISERASLQRVFGRHGETMCFHLSIAVPSNAVDQLRRELPALAPICPEWHPEVISAIAAQGSECFSVGVQCACDLFRKGATASERIQKKAKREHWSKTKLQRAIRDLSDDWSGLHPKVRDALAAVAKNAGKTSVFLFWAGRDGRSEVLGEQEVDPDAFRTDSSLVVENRLLILRNLGHPSE